MPIRRERDAEHDWTLPVEEETHRMEASITNAADDDAEQYVETIASPGSPWRNGTLPPPVAVTSEESTSNASLDSDAEVSDEQGGTDSSSAAGLSSSESRPAQNSMLVSNNGNDLWRSEESETAWKDGQATLSTSMQEDTEMLT